MKSKVTRNRKRIILQFQKIIFKVMIISWVQYNNILVQQNNIRCREEYYSSAQQKKGKEKINGMNKKKQKEKIMQFVYNKKETKA